MEKKRSKEEIIEYIKNHPKATFKEIQTNLHIHPERFFKNGLKEAFLEAGVSFPRSFENKTKDQRRKIIIDFIKNNPSIGGQTIAKETKINLASAFDNIKEAYKQAGVEYPRKESYQKPPEEKKRELIKTVKENPNIPVQELMKKIRVNPYRYFRSMKELYSVAGIKHIRKGVKRAENKKEIVLRFIRDNPLATQREVNTTCKTHIRDIFADGIFGAYKQAGIPYPFERLKLHGTALKQIKERSSDFEGRIAIKLSGYGNVNRLVKTKRGFADIIFERKGKKAIIEVKDYEAKEISISQIKQLNRYLEDCDCNLGFLVCFKKPKKDNFLIGENKIVILDESELNKIPEILDGDAYFNGQNDRLQ